MRVDPARQAQTLLLAALLGLAAGLVYAYLVFNDMSPFAAWKGGMLAICYGAEAFLILLNLVSFVTYTRAYMPYLKKALEHR